MWPICARHSCSMTNCVGTRNTLRVCKALLAVCVCVCDNVDNVERNALTSQCNLYCCVLTSSTKCKIYTGAFWVFGKLHCQCSGFHSSMLGLPCTLLTSQCNAQTHAMCHTCHTCKYAMCRLLTNDWGIHCWLQKILGSLRTGPCTAPLVFCGHQKTNWHTKACILKLGIRIPNICTLRGRM